MSKKDKLYFHEELFLLVLRDEEGTIIGSSSYSHAIAGGIIAELLLSERISVEERRKKKFLRLERSEPLGDPLIDECIEKIVAAKRRATLQTWVLRFAQIRKLKHRVAERLCERGILRADTDTILLLFTRKIYPELDPRPEKEIIARLRSAIFGNSREIDPRTTVLVSLANGTGLLNWVFDKKKLKSRKKRLEQISQGELAGKAAADAIAAAEAAIAAAVIASTIVTTTVTTSSH